MADRNFDDLAPRFQRNVYAGLKGDIRLKVLQRDFAEFLPQLTDFTQCEPSSGKAEGALTIFDAGGGQGQLSCYFASLGHSVLLCDISQSMLNMAKKTLDEKSIEGVVVENQAIQTVAAANPGRFDVVTCHAVLEWVDDPLAIITHCLSSLKPGGFLSLTYYNMNGLIYKNLLRTNYKKFKKEQWGGKRGSLTPTHPLRPEEVLAWISELPVRVICESGIRTFYDYILNPEDRQREPNTVIDLELTYSRVLPYKHLGRYIHLLLQKSE